MTLIVYGDLNIDLCARLDAFPHPGQDAAIQALEMHPGGSAANCAVVAAKLGAEVEFIGLTGQDALGQLLVDDLLAHGVGTRGLRRVNAPTGTIIALVSGDGERTFFSYRGANASQLDEWPPNLFTAQDYLHLSGYSFQDKDSGAVAMKLMTIAQAAGAKITLDPSFNFARDFEYYVEKFDLLKCLDIIFPNQEEACLMGASKTPETANENLRQRGAKTVIAKLGEQGCYIDAPDMKIHVPGYPIENVVDTIGAGDAFCGGFISGLMWNLRLDQAARLAQACAVGVIGMAGGHAGAPTLAQSIERIAAHGDTETAVQLQEHLR